MAGTDTSKPPVQGEGPVVILVEPQLGENIGMCARAMGNFGLSRLRIVNPRDGWPNVAAQRAASGADYILDAAQVVATLDEAIADVGLLFATTARAHDQAKPVVGPRAAMGEARGAIAQGTTVGILFGRERYGLQNDEVARAGRIVTFPVNPAFASLNLAQAVLLMGYEWFAQSVDGPAAAEGPLPFAMPQRSEPASQHQMQNFFDNLVAHLDAAEFLRPPEKREIMLVNLRNIFTRMEPSKQDLHTLHGVVTALTEGRKGPAKGGVLDGEQAARLRALLAEHGEGRSDHDSGTVRGLARLLRRNPTDAERALWTALKTDRRFDGQFKRQTPVGRHIPDFVSFPKRVAIEIVQIGEGGQLTLQLSHHVLPTAGLELGVYTNVGVADENYPNGKAGSPPFTFGASSAVVDFSADGATWVGLGSILFNIPANYYLDRGPFDTTAGSQVADFGKPFPGTLSDFGGLDYSQILGLLDGSAGGTWLDISGTGLSQVGYIRFSVPDDNNAGTNLLFALDAVSLSTAALGNPVPEPSTWLLLASGGCLALVARCRRARS